MVRPIPHRQNHSTAPAKAGARAVSLQYPGLHHLSWALLWPFALWPPTAGLPWLFVSPSLLFLYFVSEKWVSTFSPSLNSHDLKFPTRSKNVVIKNRKSRNGKPAAMSGLRCFSCHPESQAGLMKVFPILSPARHVSHARLSCIGTTIPLLNCFSLLTCPLQCRKYPQRPRLLLPLGLAQK